MAIDFALLLELFYDYEESRIKFIEKDKEYHSIMEAIRCLNKSPEDIKKVLEQTQEGIQKAFVTSWNYQKIAAEKRKKLNDYLKKQGLNLY